MEMPDLLNITTLIRYERYGWIYEVDIGELSIKYKKK
jgi:hypothetical protein